MKLPAARGGILKRNSSEVNYSSLYKLRNNSPHFYHRSNLRNSRRRRIKLSDYVVKFIETQGVKHVFMLVGGGAMHLVDSIGKSRKIDYVCNLHEQAASIAAEAYGQYANKIEVALVTTGPGGTNTITGVAGAWLESTACLFISGQVKRADLMKGKGVRQMGPQELDIVSIVSPITKYAVIIMEPESIRYHLEKAVYLAKTGRRGPVWIDIPLDVQASMIDESVLKGFIPGKEGLGLDSGSKRDLLKKKVRKVIDILNKAERPVIFAGNGIRLGDAIPEFKELIKILNIPVLTTWKSIDFLPESHELYMGRPGVVGQRGANFTQQNSDCLLIIGARLDLPQTAFNHKNFAREAKKIMVDIDQSEIKKMQMPIEVPIVADAKDFLKEMLAQLRKQKEKIKSQKYAWWLAKCKAWQKKYPVILPEYWLEKGHVNTYVLMDVLSDMLEASDVIVPGSSGPASEIFMQSFRVKAGQRIFNTSGLGSMGFGLPATIGACLASGGKRVICVNGDGGFQLNIQDLETIRRLNLPIKFFILNNKGYSSIVTTQRNYFASHFVGSTASSGLTLPDIRRVAFAYGIKSMLISNHALIKQKVRKALSLKGPVICEVIVSQSQMTAPRVSSMIKPNGTMVSKPMEDMYPFLDSDQFRREMIIKPLEENC